MKYCSESIAINPALSEPTTKFYYWIFSEFRRSHNSYHWALRVIFPNFKEITNSMVEAGRGCNLWESSRRTCPKWKHCISHKNYQTLIYVSLRFDVCAICTVFFSSSPPFSCSWTNSSVLLSYVIFIVELGTLSTFLKSKGIRQVEWSMCLKTAITTIRTRQ